MNKLCFGIVGKIVMIFVVVDVESLSQIELLIILLRFKIYILVFIDRRFFVNNLLLLYGFNFF